MAALLAEKGDRYPHGGRRARRARWWPGPARAPTAAGPPYAGVAEHSVYVARAARGAGVGPRGPGRAVPDVRGAGVLEDRLAHLSREHGEPARCTSAAASGWSASTSATASSTANGATASSSSDSSTDPRALEDDDEQDARPVPLHPQLRPQPDGRGLPPRAGGRSLRGRERGDGEDDRASPGHPRDGGARHRHQRPHARSSTSSSRRSAGTTHHRLRRRQRAVPIRPGRREAAALVVRGPLARAGRRGGAAGGLPSRAGRRSRRASRSGCHICGRRPPA